MLIFSLYSLSNIEKIYTELSNQIEEIEYHLEKEDYEKATEEAKTFFNMWHIREKTLVRIIRHHAIDEVTASTSRMLTLVENEEKAHALVELNSIKIILYQVYEEEIPYLHNIF